LHSLLQRSVPSIRFVPCTRQFRLRQFDRFDRGKGLPHWTLREVFDEGAWSIAEDAEAVALVVDSLKVHRASIESFPQEISPYLEADGNLRLKWRRRLSALAGRPHVGIAWRSISNVKGRHLEYTDIADWEPILSQNANFISLQYGSPHEELSLVAKRLGIDVVEFAELDAFNDLESLAALISELDFVLAPCIATAELAAAVGANTLMMCNSPGTKWRQRADGSDLWFPNLQLVFGDSYYDRASLIRNTADWLQHAIDRYQRFSRAVLPSLRPN
jgi:capsular polysaccharide export protein